MRLRSLLFVPADSEKKYLKAQDVGADVLILDLEDSVAPANKTVARETLATWIDAAPSDRNWEFWVRVNAFDTGMTDEDLQFVVRPGLDGIMLPKSSGGEDVARLGALLDELEPKAGMKSHTVRIIPVTTETACAVFNLGSYSPAHPRLAALTWGAEDLAAVVGATANRDENGQWTQPYQLVRSLCLFAAAAAGVPAIDTVFTDFRDAEGLELSCRAGRRDGFTGAMAIHPAQVGIIKDAFSPSQAELELAQKIVATFQQNPDLGTVGIGGKMYDIPHLKQARRTLGLE